MIQLDRSLLIAAMKQTGYDEWVPNFDVPSLNRPRQRPVELPGEGKEAAVLFLVYRGQQGRPSIVLTRRRNDMSKHPGQIALPGGRQDANETLQQTALRETEEEIGVDLESIEILGRLNQVYIPPSDFTVTPFVGWLAGDAKFVRAEYEVAEILEVSIEFLLNPGTLVMGEVSTWNKEDPSKPRKIQAPYYAVGAHQVWGATAIMLDEFLDRIRRVA